MSKEYMIFFFVEKNLRAEMNVNGKPSLQPPAGCD